jgi:hypothetical protein
VSSSTRRTAGAGNARESNSDVAAANARLTVEGASRRSTSRRPPLRRGYLGRTGRWHRAHAVPGGVPQRFGAAEAHGRLDQLRSDGRSRGPPQRWASVRTARASTAQCIGHRLIRPAIGSSPARERRCPSCTRPSHATGSVSTKPRPPTSSTPAMPSTAMRNGCQSRRSEMPAKNSTAAKKTVARMYRSSWLLASVPSR